MEYGARANGHLLAFSGINRGAKVLDAMEFHVRYILSEMDMEAFECH